MLPSRNATSETVIWSRNGPPSYTVATSISAASWVSQARNPSSRCFVLRTYTWSWFGCTKTAKLSGQRSQLLLYARRPQHEGVGAACVLSEIAQLYAALPNVVVPRHTDWLEPEPAGCLKPVLWGILQTDFRENPLSVIR
jgi:hypothetical protein